VLLRHDLQGITNPHCEHSAIDKGRRGKPDAVQAGFFEDCRQQQTDDRAGHELQKGQANGVMTTHEKAHQQHMNAPYESASQLYPVAGSDLKVFVDAEQRHANHGEYCA